MWDADAGEKWAAGDKKGRREREELREMCGRGVVVLITRDDSGAGRSKNGGAKRTVGNGQDFKVREKVKQQGWSEVKE